MKNRLAALLLVVFIAGLSGFYILKQQEAANAANEKPPAAKTVKPAITTSPAPADFNKSLYSIDDPVSPWAVINKRRPLQPKTYVPTDLIVANVQLRSNITSNERQLRSVTAEALRRLADAAKADGLTVTLQSGYRSYDFQANLYNRYVSQQGQAVADTQSARAGHSEHQTGLALDVGGTTSPACNLETCFAISPEGKWITLNAYKYGFIIRYPAGKTSVTGYMYEPWHLRYVGTELSMELRAKSDLTMEEFFGLPAAPDYN